jgi:hypothetical protein
MRVDLSFGDEPLNAGRSRGARWTSEGVADRTAACMVAGATGRCPRGAGLRRGVRRSRESGIIAA